MTDPGPAAWQRALLAARILAIGRHRVGGLHLRARSGPVRDAWIDFFRSCLPPDTPWRRITPTVPVARLIGGLDLVRTLEVGRPRLEQGVLGSADGGFVVLSMAERAAADFAATIGLAMDNSGIHIERSGLSLFEPSDFSLLCLDEGADIDERLPPALADRLALSVDLSSVSWSHAQQTSKRQADASPWRAVTLPVAVEEALQTALLACGRRSLRTAIWIRRISKLVAALHGADTVETDHAALALQLVIPTAVEQTAPEPEAADEAADQPTDAAQDFEPSANNQDDRPEPTTDLPPEEILVAARKALLPDFERRRDTPPTARVRVARQSGKSGFNVKSGRHGRPLGVSATPPSPGARLNVPATLRAAAPWQGLRRRRRGPSGRPVELRKSDFRYQRLQDRTETTAILCVDASGSTALERLGEAKGAAELLLADCYVRRERVALIAFRAERADILLPPTRSLVRAKKCLASLVGGGGTPIAAGMAQALQLAMVAQRQGHHPLVVLLTDGSANIALDGSANRPAARHDAETLAVQFRQHRISSIVIDIALRTRPTTRELAEAMDAAYYTLPRADARSVSTVVSTHLRAG